MCEKRKKNKKKKKTKKLSQFLKSHISGMPEAISLKFGMWSTEVGGNACFIKAAQSYGGAKIAFSFFLSIYSRGCAPASWDARHTTVCLDTNSMHHRRRKGGGGGGGGGARGLSPPSE